MMIWIFISTHIIIKRRNKKQYSTVSNNVGKRRADINELSIHKTLNGKLTKKALTRGLFLQMLKV